MKNLINPLLLISLILPFIFACSSNGRGYARAKYCSSASDPLNVEKIKKGFSRKIEVKPGEVTNPNEGLPPADEYTFSDSMVYFQDLSQDIKLVIRYSKNRTGVYTDSLDCISGKGIRKNMSPISESINIVTGVLVDNQNKIQIKTRTLKIDFSYQEKEKWLVYKMSVDETPYAEYTGEAKDLFPGYDTANQFFFTLNGGNSTRHQLISQALSIAKDAKFSNVEVRTLSNLRTLKK